MKTRSFFPLLTTVVVLIMMASACNAPAKKEEAVTEAKPDMAKIKSDIQAIETEWASAINARDINRIMAVYADDAVSMANNGPMLEGKAAIQQDQEKNMKTAKTGNVMSFETLDVYGDGDVVTETGKSTTKDATGKVVGTGKYMAVYEKRDGTYRCIREIYNNDKPEK